MLHTTIPIVNKNALHVLKTHWEGRFPVSVLNTHKHTKYENSRKSQGLLFNSEMLTSHFF